jgi:hypothetical protein
VPVLRCERRGWLNELLADYECKLKAQQVDLEIKEADFKKASAALRAAETAVTRRRSDRQDRGCDKGTERHHDGVFEGDRCDLGAADSQDVLASIKVTDTRSVRVSRGRKV